MSKMTHKLPLKNVLNFHPELKDCTEELIERKSLIANFTGLTEGEAIGIVSTPAIDQDGDIIDPMGIKTDIYNGTVQWNHDLTTLPIGTINDWTIDPNGVKGKFTFSKTYEFSVDCYNLVKEGILKGISIGYVPLQILKKGTEAFYNYAKAKGWDINGCERIITSCLWIETSLCPVGCNQEALILAAKNFKSEMAFKAFKVEQKSEDAPALTEKDMDALVEECKGNTAEKFFEEKSVEAVSSTEVVSEIVQEEPKSDTPTEEVKVEEPVVETPDIQIVEEPKEIEKPLPKITVIRRGGLKPTEQIK